MTRPRYRVRRAVAIPELLGLCHGPAWNGADVLSIASFHPRSSDHRPVTDLRLIHDDQHLYALFLVKDRFVRSVHTEYDSDTYKDSCVELFVQPAHRAGYFAFEASCGGAFSLRYIEDPTRTADRFAKWTMVEPALASLVRVAHAMPAMVEPERSEPTAWWVELAWPLAVMERYCGPIGRPDGQRWRANAFKCGDETSHPHWASWAPIGETLNFHQPGCFGEFDFTG